MTSTSPSLAAKREAARAALVDLAATDPYEQFVNPRLARLLHGFGLDVTFVRGAGTVLHDRDGRSYLDFAGAYGALPFGHNPPQLWDAVQQFIRSAEPSLVQPAPQAAAGELARQLIRIAPGDLRYVFFANSGAEAVEAAIKLARAATGRMLVVSALDSFHGKTLGALSATGRRRYQTPFGAPAGGFTSVPFGSAEALGQMFAEHGDDIAAFIVEPIQGEGGVRPAPPGYLALARRLCTEHGAKLILDEVQTGLGRTGRMFAAEHDGVAPDIMPLAKALGGGVVPIGAVLYNSGSASEDFALRHTSTFGGNAFCARVAMAALDLLTAGGGQLVQAAAVRGRQLRHGLDDLAERYPRIVREVRGRGLLLGLELSTDPSAYPRQGLFRSLAAQEGLAAFTCGHLLREEGIRIAPTFFAAAVLRVEPPLTVTAEECAAFLGSLDRALARIVAARSDRFFAFLGSGTGSEPRDTTAAGPSRAGPAQPVTPRAGEPRWAFLAHPTDDLSYETFDAGLGWSGAQVRRLFHRMNACRTPDVPAAMFVGACRVEAGGTSSYGEVFALPHNARQLLDLPASMATALVQQAVDQAVHRGAQIVGLGAYTSVITANGTTLTDPGVPVTTGNSYTVAIGADGLLAAGRAAGVDPATAGCLVLGAAGAIGRTATLLLAESVGTLVLAGNPAGASQGRQRLIAVAHDVVAHLRSRPTAAERRPGSLAELVTGLTGTSSDVVEELAARRRLTCTADPAAAIAGADLILTATSTPDALITPDGPRPGAVICDISQPSNLSPALGAARPDLRLLTGGLVELPGRPPLGMDLGLPLGVIYACMAETLVLAHQLPDPAVSFGARLSPGHVRMIGARAHRLGLTLHLPSTAD